MIFDLDAYEAAGLLQGMFWRRGRWDKNVCLKDGWVHVGGPSGWVRIKPDFALFTARIYWKETE